MNPAEIFIRRPVMTTLLMVALVVFGIMAYHFLPVSDLPQVDYPTIAVSASLPGASASKIAATVATPLEKQFSDIAGLRAMNSTSQTGSTQITLQFHLSRNINNCALDVQSAIGRAEAFLPKDMPTPPSYQKTNPSDYPILYIAVTSRTLPLYTLDKYAETLMAQNISTVSGVAEVEVFGSQTFAVRVQVNPNLLASRGVDINQVATAVQTANVELPSGTIYGRHTQYTLRPTGQLKNAAAYRKIIVRYRNGSPVLRLDQLGRVIDSVQNDKLAGWFDGRRSVILAVQRQPGTNTIEIVNGIRKLLPHLRAQIPASVSYHVVYDRSQEIRASVSDVKMTLGVALIFVILVIFLFLRNIRATIIPSLAIPVSLLATFACMYMLGFTVDNLSLLALTLCIGFVVDDAIVMLENSVRHMEMGKAAMPATLEASREIGFTIVSMTLSLTAVFIPILFMGGMLGRLLNEFAVTIACAILFSGVVSLTLTPMLCSRFLKPPHGRHNFLYNMMEHVFNGMLWLYESILRLVLKARLLTMLLSAVVLAATIYLMVTIPRTLFPTEDMSQLFGFTMARQGISFQDMVKHQMAIMKIIQKDPNVAGYVSFCGGGGPLGATNQGIVFMHLKPISQRAPVQVVQQELMRKLNTVTGMQVFLQVPPVINLNGALTKGQYQYTLQSFDTATLYKDARVLTNKMRAIPGLIGVSSDLYMSNPQVKIKILRNRAKTLGLTPQDVELALQSAYGSRQISTIYTNTNEYYVILELEPKFQRRPDQIPLLYLHSSNGHLVPLSAVTRMKENVGPLEVNHLGQLPAVTISFNLLPGASLSAATSKIESLSKHLLPPSISTSFQGAAQVYQSSVQSLGLLLIVAIAVIYIVLGILYESFIHPLTILTALPFAGFGALLTLEIFHSNLNLYSFVGIIMLIGLVKKNGIMIVDFAIAAQRDEGKSPREAIYQACVIRFRPIMMTTMAALVGTLPIAIGWGAGAGSRRPLGLAVVGGLLFSQLLTLFVTPVFYLYMEQFRGWFHPHEKSGDQLTQGQDRNRDALVPA